MTEVESVILAGCVSRVPRTKGIMASAMDTAAKMNIRQAARAGTSPLPTKREQSGQSPNIRNKPKRSDRPPAKQIQRQDAEQRGARATRNSLMAFRRHLPPRSSPAAREGVCQIDARLAPRMRLRRGPTIGTGDPRPVSGRHRR